VTEVVGKINLANYPLYWRGKVRDVFDLGSHLLLVASDRISAFDVVLPTLLPQKGVILTGISRFWFDKVAAVRPTQLTGIDLESLDLGPGELELLSGRSVVVKKADRIDIECVVRAFLAGSAWLEYQKQGTIAGYRLPEGMRRGDRLPDILFTPAIKNDLGHDENISIDQLHGIVGVDLANRLEQASREIFELGSKVAAGAGFVLADTKFEFGWIDGELAVIDEVLTPDSSRYWDTSQVAPGTEPPAYDKQPVRDWLESSGWNKEAPAPELPPNIVNQTLDRYRAVAQRLQSTAKGA
jgi:phosphoribosylaminoimidazole-succinocarboxamide synthase